MVLLAGLVILFLRWRNGREEEPVPAKEEVLVQDGKGKAIGKNSASTSEEAVGAIATKPESDAGRSQEDSSGRNSAMAGSNKGSGKKVRVVG